MNFYTVKKEINGKEYTAQFCGLGAMSDIIDSSYIPGTKNTSYLTLFRKFLDLIIVSPKLSVSDFGKDIIGKKAKIKVGGKEYTAEFKGIETALKFMDETYIDGTSNTSVRKANEYVLRNVITSPEDFTMDDFETAEEMNEVLEFGREAMQGWGLMNEVNQLITFAREVAEGKFRDSAAK